MAVMHRDMEADVVIAGAGLAPGVITFDFEEALREGFLLRGDTVADLARKIEIDARALIETLERYNSTIARGETDEFGRTALSNSYGSPTRARTWDLRINRISRNLRSFFNQALATHAKFQEQ